VPEKSRLRSARRKSESISIEAALTVGDGDCDGMQADPRRYRWLDIDAGGRPPRDNAEDEAWRDRLAAALAAAPEDDLCGARGRPTIEACELYLQAKCSQVPRKISREVAKAFIRRK
jgi:hypothetical protein